MTDLSAGTGPTNQAKRALNLALFTDRLTAVSDISIFTRLRRRLATFWTKPAASTDIRDYSRSYVRDLITKPYGCGCNFNFNPCGACVARVKDIYPYTD